MKEDVSRKCIVGPSHIVRWQHLFSNTLTDLPAFDHYAIGGLPIWDNELISFLNDAEDKYDEIYVLVGDFRFGNDLFSEIKKRHLGIKKDNINIGNDTALLKRAIEALDVICKIKNVKIIFWDLYLREFLNKKTGRYVINKHYQHPLWNYDFFKRRYCHKNIDLSLLDSLNIDLLFVDSSLHPSILGYCFLFNLFTDQSVTDSFLSSLRLKGEVDKDLYCRHSSVIIGNGPFFRTIQLYISKGIISLPSNVQLYRADDALFTKRKEVRTLIFFSESKSGDDLKKSELHIERSNWARKIHFELSYVKENTHREAMFEITNNLPSFLFLYSILHHVFNNGTHTNFDSCSYKKLLNNHFRRSCLCLS
jgi:hypothetical protein